MNRLSIVEVAMLLFFASCAPRPVYRMKPIAGNTTFNRGVEYVYRQQAGVTMTLSYFQHWSKKFVMDVEIVNNSDSVLRVDPRQFSYDAYLYYSADTTDGSSAVHPTVKLASRKAINPEEKLLEKDKAIARSAAHQKTSDLFYGIGQTANIASAIMADTKEKRDEIEANSNEYALYHAISKLDRKHKRYSLMDQRKTWEIATIRKTDLFPGEYIRGYVFFKTSPHARGYVINYKNGGTRFNVFFRQLRYDSN